MWWKSYKIVNLLVVAILLFAVPLSIGAMEWHRNVVSDEWVDAYVYDNSTRFVRGCLGESSAPELFGGYYKHYTTANSYELDAVSFYNASDLSDGMCGILVDAKNTTDGSSADIVILGFNVSAYDLLQSGANRFVFHLNYSKGAKISLWYQGNGSENVHGFETVNVSNDSVSLMIDSVELMSLVNNHGNGHFMIKILSASASEEMSSGDIFYLSMSFQKKRGTAGLLAMETVAGILGGALIVLGAAITPFFNPLDRRGEIFFLPMHHKSSQRKSKSSHRTRGHARYHKSQSRSYRNNRRRR